MPTTNWFLGACDQPRAWNQAPAGLLHPQAGHPDGRLLVGAIDDLVSRWIRRAGWSGNSKNVDPNGSPLNREYIYIYMSMG